MLKLQITHATVRNTPLPALRRQLFQAARVLAHTSGSWSITLIRDPAMKSLHRRTMNDPSTTDVLTFDLRDNPAHPLDLDTVICVDVAQRRAKELGHPLGHEILLYALHSLLHVCGYNDLTSPQAAAMHAREDEILTALGVGAVYAPAKRSPKLLEKRRKPTKRSIPRHTPTTRKRSL